MSRKDAQRRTKPHVIGLPIEYAAATTVGGVSFEAAALEQPMAYA
jgi:hypothetical protein